MSSESSTSFFCVGDEEACGVAGLAEALCEAGAISGIGDLETPIAVHPRRERTLPVNNSDPQITPTPPPSRDAALQGPNSKGILAPEYVARFSRSAAGSLQLPSASVPVIIGVEYRGRRGAFLPVLRDLGILLCMLRKRSAGRVDAPATKYHSSGAGVHYARRRQQPLTPNPERGTST